MGGYLSLQPGTTLGRYQIIEPLGQGGMATVYKAFQPSLEREVALKVLRPGFAQDQEFRDRFEREAKSIARLRHPNIVQVFDFEVSPSGEFVLAMEFLDGGTLKERTTQLASQGRGLDPADTVRIVWEVADALTYAHEQGIVHRDVKPSNVMLAKPRDRAVVTDFGIARILGATSHTQTGVGIGTPEYMAPEQGQGGQIDHRADIYSLGAMAYELLTGRVPYSADTPLAVVLAHIKDPLPLPSKVNPTIGKSVERALLKALAKDPAQRFDSATAFADALRAGLAEDSKGGTMPTIVVGGAGEAGTPTSRRAPAAPKQLTLSVPPILARRPMAVVITGALVLALVAGGALAGNALRGSPTPSPTPSPQPQVGAAPASPLAPAGGIPGQASPPPSGLSFAAMHGPQIYAATLGSASDVTVNGPSGFVSVKDGTLTLTTPEAGRATEVVLGPSLPVDHAVEMDVAIDQGSTMRFAVCVRSEGERKYCATSLGTSIEMRYLGRPGETGNSFGGNAPVQLAGRTVRLGIVAQRSTFTVFVDGRAVLQASDPQIATSTLPLSFQAQRLGTAPDKTGSARISNVKLYAGLTGAAAAPTVAAASPPKFAIPPKGKLIFEAKLDGSGNDLTRPITQMGDPAATAIRQVPGAIELEVVKPSIQQNGQCPNCIMASATFSLPRRSTYVGEFEVEVRPRSDVSVHFQLYNVRGAGYYLGLQTVGGDGREGTIFLGCTPGVANCPANSLVTDLVRIPPAGQRFTIGIDLREDRITVFLDQKEVLKVATLLPLNGVSSPGVQVTGPQDVPGTGLVRLLGTRFYELP